MALSNSQYDALIRTYEQRQTDNVYALRRRYTQVYSCIPELKELDDSISSLSVEKAKQLIEGDASALSSFRRTMEELTERKRTLLLKNHVPADYMELHYTCPDCRDTGYLGSKKCHCFNKAVIDLLYTQSNLEGILELENFDTFSLDYYSASHIDPLTGRSSREAIQTALDACHKFVDTFSAQFSNILLYGDTGVGKTFLSHCIAKELIERSYSVIYFSASMLFDLLAKETFSRESTEDETHTHIYECDLLIIDDLGSELSNTFTTSQLFTILNERSLRRRSTVISTNLALEDLKGIYSERIFSRISSSYKMLRLTGDDIRIQKKLLNLGGTNDATP